MVPYVDAVNVMRVLLFGLLLYMMRSCVSDGNAGVVVVSVEHVGGTRSVSSTADVLGMSVMRGVVGVREMCLARGGIGDGVSVREDSVYQSCGNSGSLVRPVIVVMRTSSRVGN